MMEMTIEEFKEKVSKINNLAFIKMDGYYYWQAQGSNEDLKNYMVEQLSANLILTDAYIVSERDKCNVWIPKTEIEKIVQHIISAESYEEIKPQSPFIKKTEIIKKDNVLQQIKIHFKSDDIALTAKRCVAGILEENENIDVEIYRYELTISKKDVDEKVRCRHRCQTDKKIAEFDEIFGL